MTSQLLDRVPLFAGLGPSQRRLIEEHLQEMQFAAGDALFHQGEPATRVFLVESGWVRLITSAGVVLATLGRGSTLADLDLLLNRAYATGAEAVGAVTAYTLSAADIERLVHDDADLGLALSRGAGTPIAAMRTYVRNRLQSVPGWRRASRASLMAAVERLSLHDASAGKRLYAAGDPPAALYIVERGQVRLSEPSAPGQEVTVGAGAVFGDMSLLTGKAHVRSAVVVENAVLWSLTARAFAELTAEYPELRESLSRELRSPLGVADQKLAVERLRTLPTFSRWPDDALQEVASVLLMQHVPAGIKVYTHGAPGDALYVVDNGQIELRARGEVLARLTSGNEFGEMALLTGRTRVADAVATLDSNLWVLYRSDYERLQARYPAVQAAMTESVAQRLAAADEAFLDQHLRKIPLLAGLSRAQLEAVRRRLQAVRFREGEAIYRQGDEGDGLYMIERGQVRLEQGDRYGATTLALLRDGDIFGEGALLLEEPRDVSAWSQSDADLWLLRREDFEDLMLQYPSLALNLSRVLRQRLRQSAFVQPHNGELAAASVAAATTASAATASRWRQPTAQPATQVAPAPRRASTSTAKPASAGPGAIRASIDRATDWFQGLNTLAKILLIFLALVLIFLCGVSLPSLVLETVRAAEAQVSEMTMTAALPVRGGVEAVDTPTPPPGVDVGNPIALALANTDIEATPTYTPWPTETPIPTNTPTVTPTPTNTATPTDTPTPLPTDTPIPTNTPRPTPTPPPVQVEVQAVAAAAPTEPPPPSVEWRLVSARRLEPCENRGRHHIFITVLDAAGNPVDGVLLIQAAANNFGQIMDRMPSGAKGPGEAEFTMWKGAEYAVFIANPDGSPASTEFAQPLHSAFTDEALCSDGGGGNTLFHNSFEVIFQRTS